MGRAPLDETTVRLLEDHHPDIQFDWPQILRGDEEKEPPYPGPPPTPVSAPPPLPTDPINPAHAQLGSEGLARLRARYGELMAAIARRVTDPERQDRLRDEAARLNPDNWVTDDEVRQALEQYEAVFESLRGVIAGSGRRRRRRRPGGAGPEPGRADPNRTEPGRTDSGGADPGRPVAASGPTGPPGPGDRSPSGPAGPDRGPSQN